MTRPCIFCQIEQGTLPAARVLETPHVLAFLDKTPLFPGHVLLVPRQHIATLDEVPEDLLPNLWREAQRLCRAVERAMDAQGTFVAVNNRVSQSVPHLHVHIVPRRKGDGLKGFFWPRSKYTSPEHVEQVQSAIAAALDSI